MNMKITTMVVVQGEILEDDQDSEHLDVDVVDPRDEAIKAMFFVDLTDNATTDSTKVVVAEDTSMTFQDLVISPK